MPFLNGRELTEKIREFEIYKQIPILCASAQEIDMKKPENKCFTGSILKPISFSDAQRLIDTFIKYSEYHDCFSNSENNSRLISKGFEGKEGTWKTGSSQKEVLPNEFDMSMEESDIMPNDLMDEYQPKEEIKVHGIPDYSIRQPKSRFFIDQP